MELIIPIFLYLMVIDYTIGDEILWSLKMKRELINIYYTTSPDDPGHEERVKEKWDRKFPNYENKISSKELYEYANNLIEIISHPGENESFPWTSEINKKLLKIYYEARPDWKFQEYRMKKLWKEAFPHLSAEADHLDLRDQAKKLLARIHRIKEDKKAQFSWPSNIDQFLFKIHREIPYNERGRSQKMKDIFDLWFPQYKDQVTVNSLRQHLSSLLRRTEKYRNEGHKRKLQLHTNLEHETNAEILHIYHQTAPRGWFHESKMQQCWNAMHPEMINSTQDNLRERAQKLISERYKPDPEHMKNARIKFNQAFPKGFEGKGKRVIQEKSQSSTSVNQQEPESSQFHRNDPIHSPFRHQKFSNKSEMHHQMASSSQLPQHVSNIENYDSFLDKYGRNSQFEDQQHPEFNFDGPIFSPIHHQEFVNEFEMHHSIASSSQLPHHVPNTRDSPSYHDQYGNSSQSHDQHH